MQSHYALESYGVLHIINSLLLTSLRVLQLHYESVTLSIVHIWYVQEVCHRYWPQGKGETQEYGKLAVTFKDQKAFSEYVVRKFEIVENQNRTSVAPTGTIITQFHYLRWQENSVPNSTTAILEIANLVQKVQMSTGNKPIVVICK